MKIREVMHQPVKCCDSTMSLDQVATRMWNEDVGIVPIVDREQKLEGVITDRDIAMAATLKHKPLWEISASELIAGKHCHYCSADDDLQKVLEVMKNSRIRRVPVVDDQQHVSGMVGLKDLAEHVTVNPTGGDREGLTALDVMGTVRQIFKAEQLQTTG